MTNVREGFLFVRRCFHVSIFFASVKVKTWNKHWRDTVNSLTTETSLRRTRNAGAKGVDRLRESIVDHFKYIIMNTVLYLASSRGE